MSQTLANRINDLLRNNKLEEALHLLEQTEYRNEAIQLYRRFRENWQAHHKGTIGLENYQLEQNKISNSLQEFTRDLPSNLLYDQSRETHYLAPKAVDSIESKLAAFLKFSLYLAGFFFLCYGFYLLAEGNDLLTFFPYLIPIGLVISTYTLPDLLKRRKKQELSNKSDVNFSPEYFRLTPYGAEDLSSYHRADGMHETVLKWIEKHKSDILYLSGESGTGKSSLLSGYVIPKLTDIEVIEIRGYTHPVQALQKALQGKGIADAPVEEMLTAYRNQLQKRCLLVFDQFEEFLILRGKEEQKELEELLQELHVHPIQGVSVLLVFRSDYLGEIGKLNFPDLDFNRNWKVVSPFSTHDAKMFLQGSGLKVGEEVLKSILNEAQSLEGKEGLIRPIILNMYGMILSRYAGQLPKGVAPEELLKAYLEESIKMSNFQGDAKEIMRSMITKKGTKQPRSEKEVATLTKLDPAVVKGFFLELVPKGIVRRIDKTQQVWEVSHDFLALLLHRSLFSWQMPWYSRVAQWATPLLMLLWLAGVPQWQERKTVTQLDKLEFTTSLRNEGGYKIEARDINDSLFQKASILMSQLDVRDLGLERTLITSLPSLKGLTNLQFLDLNNTQIDSLPSLEGLTNLQFLDLNYTPIDSLPSLEGLTSLQSLYLSETPIDSLPSLEGLTSLQSLYLSETPIDSLPSLEGLTNLQSLNLGGTPVDSLPSLEGLTSLQSLYLSETPIDSLPSLEGLTSLQYLDLSETPIDSLPSLEGLTSLQYLDLNYTQIDSLPSLEGLTSLQYLDLNNTPIDSLPSLEGLTSLQSLYLSETPIDSLPSLEGLTSLQSLDLSETPIDSLPSLEGLTNLQYLYLNGTQITTLASLEGLTSLKTLDLSETNLTDRNSQQVIKKLLKRGVVVFLKHPIPELIPFRENMD